MSKANITTVEAAKCLSILREANKPIVAAELAYRLGLAGSRESQRRHVRALIKRLRDDGSKIIATLWGGYFLTEDEQLWRDYLDGRQIDAKRILGETHRRKKNLAAGQQQMLFEPPRICCGVATCGVS